MTSMATGGAQRPNNPASQFQDLAGALVSYLGHFEIPPQQLLRRHFTKRDVQDFQDGELVFLPR